jgi:hypothetical protein
VIPRLLDDAIRDGAPGVHLVSDDQAKRPSEVDAALKRGFLQGREFTLADVIGRMAGPGIMKGASPVTRRDQAAAEIHEYPRQHLADAAGALSSVLARQVAESDLLLNARDRPLVVLAGHVRRVLDSGYGLGELVRETDVEWGQMYGERPFFENEGCPPAPGDPYTFESVRAALTQLAKGLAEDQR